MRRLSLSLFIAGFLGLQVMVGGGWHPGPIEPPPYLWPFLDYPMYSRSHQEGDEIRQSYVVGIRSDSSEVIIQAGDLGLHFFLYLKGPVRALRRGDDAEARFYREVYAERHGVELIGMRLKARPFVVTRDGYHQIPVRVLATTWFETADEGP